MTEEADLKNYQLQWKTETGGGSVLWNTEQARPDDDDDDETPATFFCRKRIVLMKYFVTEFRIC